MSSRRDALRTLAAFAIVGLIPWMSRADATAPDAIERIGLQLYAVRSPMNKDRPGTMAAVATTGYREVEFAGSFGRTPAEVRQLLHANGLTAPSTHLGLADVRERFDATAESAQASGIRYLTVASLDMRAIKTTDDWKRMADYLKTLRC